MTEWTHADRNVAKQTRKNTDLCFLYPPMASTEQYIRLNLSLVIDVHLQAAKGNSQGTQACVCINISITLVGWLLWQFPQKGVGCPVGSGCSVH